jgi:hypothetical protein
LDCHGPVRYLLISHYMPSRLRPSHSHARQASRIERS